MSNRDDWSELVKEILDAYGVLTTIRNRVHPAGAPTAKSFVERLETELHNAFVAGQESVECSAPEIDEGWRYRFQQQARDFLFALEATKNLTEACYKGGKKPEDMLVELLEAAFVVGQGSNRSEPKLEAPEGMEVVECVIATTPEVAKAMRGGKFKGISVSGGTIRTEEDRRIPGDRVFNKLETDLASSEEDEDSTEQDIAAVRLELLGSIQALWEAINTLEWNQKKKECEGCVGTMDTHRGDCPIAYADALEMRITERVTAGLNRLRNTLTKHHERISGLETDEDCLSEVRDQVRILTDQSNGHAAEIAKIDSELTAQIRNLKTDQMQTDRNQLEIRARIVSLEDSLTRLADKLTNLETAFEHSPERSFLTYGSEDAVRWHRAQHDADGKRFEALDNKLTNLEKAVHSLDLVYLAQYHVDWHNPRHPDEEHKEPLDTKVDTLEAFIPGLGTVRECIDCGCLVPGGPTRCKLCAKDKHFENNRARLKKDCDEIVAANDMEELTKLEQQLEEQGQRDLEGLDRCMKAAKEVSEAITDIKGEKADEPQS